MNNGTQQKQDSLFNRINVAKSKLNQMELILEAMYSAMDGIETSAEKFEKALPRQQKQESPQIKSEWTEKDSAEVAEIAEWTEKNRNRLHK